MSISLRFVTIALLHLLIPGSFAVFFLLPEETVIELAIEDGPIENMGAVGFFVASALFFVTYIRSGSQGNDLWILRTRRNVFFLLLGLAFFFAGGEEISWGQRIFGWETPEKLAEINAQGETTIHNLTVLPGHKAFEFYFWFNVSWFLFCLVVPILNRVRFANTLFEKICLPIVPLWTGVLLFTSYVVFKLVAISCSNYELRMAANELKESTGGIIFAIIACVLFYRSYADRKDTEPQTSYLPRPDVQPSVSV